MRFVKLLKQFELSVKRLAEIAVENFGKAIVVGTDVGIHLTAAAEI